MRTIPEMFRNYFLGEIPAREVTKGVAVRQAEHQSLMGSGRVVETTDARGRESTYEYPVGGGIKITGQRAVEKFAEMRAQDEYRQNQFDLGVD